MPRGGARTPSKPAATSGPGKFSKRTDGQAVRTPKLEGSDLQYGDVGKLAAAQKVAPLPNGVAPPKTTGGRQPQGAPMQRGQLPSYLFDTPSARPGSPGTTGLSTGPGAGPEALDSATPPSDMREQVMQYLWETFQNTDAMQWLIDFRNERAAASATGGPMGPAQMQGAVAGALPSAASGVTQDLGSALYPDQGKPSKGAPENWRGGMDEFAKQAEGG